MKMTGRQGDMSILAGISVRPSEWARLARASDCPCTRPSLDTENVDLAGGRRLCTRLDPKCQPKQFRFNKFGMKCLKAGAMPHILFRHSLALSCSETRD